MSACAHQLRGEARGRRLSGRPSGFAGGHSQYRRSCGDHFLNDNTSPETYSLHIVSVRPSMGNGLALARETAKRFLLNQLLVSYANDKFELRRHGQEAIIFFSPHTPVRQKQLNECISDAYYRELFMSPCLSGWERGLVRIPL